VNRIRKLEAAASALKERTETYFPITRLTSLKSLCKDPDIAAQFAFYLSNLILEKVSSSSCPRYIDAKDWENYKKLIKRAVSLMKRFMKDPGERNQSSVRNMLRQVKKVQNETRPGPWGSLIRTIHSKDVLIIEKSICCLLYPDNASYWVYHLARNYTEEYNPSYGAGLIPESVPALRDIISFMIRFFIKQTS
jgi:hypothetical protein